jgi:heme exporter protein D
MLINGILSHKQYLREQEEQKAKQTPASQQEATTR